MVPNDDFDGKTTYLNCFNIHMIFEQKYPKPAIVGGGSNPRLSVIVMEGEGYKIKCRL